jgi:sugar phosphate isomerase/epimerase
MPEAGNQDVTLMIEPLSKKETDFIQSTHEAHEMVQNISHQHFGLHLDVKAMIDSGENFQDIFKKYGQVACHLHVGDPGLAPPGHTGFDHKVIGDAIESSFYKRIISIEMKRGFGNTQDVLTNAIAYVKSCYPIDDAGIK